MQSEWWHWELEVTPHLEKRTADRGFDEIDLRAMLENATGYRPDIVQGRWIIETKIYRRTWEVIVEPDSDEKMLVVVTAYGFMENRKRYER